MSRYVVTGATGFIGGALTRALLAEGHRVTAIGRNTDLLRDLDAEGATAIAFDLTSASTDLAIQLGEEPDAVIHCAGLSSLWGDKAAFRTANLNATSGLLEAAARRGCRHFVHVSSPSVGFAFRNRLSVREDEPLPVPVNAYAWSKAACEREVGRASASMPTTIIRPRGVYGRGDTALLPRMVRACARGWLPLMNGGRAVTDLTHVDDAVDAMIAVLRAGPPAAGRTFNVSGGDQRRLVDIVDAAAIRAGGTRPTWKPRPWRAVDLAARGVEALARLRGSGEPTFTRYAVGILAFSQTLDIEAIAAATGWRPTIGFEEGLERTFR